MGYLVAVKKHLPDTFQFSRRYKWPSPEKLLDRGLPG
jgi:hypothetical protein